MRIRKLYTAGFLICLFCIFFLYPVGVSAKSTPEKLTLNYQELTLYTGEIGLLKVVSVKPEDASDEVIWKSKDKETASVSKKGIVTAKKAGKTEITAVSKENPKVKKNIKVTVKKRPAQTEKEIAVKGQIYRLKDFSGQFHQALQSAMPGLYLYHHKKGYERIASKKEYKNLLQNIKKNGGGKIANSFFADYKKTNFKNKSLVFVQCSLNYPVDMSVIGMETKFNKSGRLCGEITLQYRDGRDPELSYPAVMTDCVVVLELDKKDAAMIDCFKYTAMLFDY